MATETGIETSVNLFGKRFKVKAISGIVEDIREKSTISISGTNNHVDSTVTEHQSIFLVTGDGKEKSVELKNFTVPARAGNLLSLIWVGRPEKADGYYAVAYNHDQQRLIPSSDSLAAAIYDRSFFKSFVVFVVCIVLLSYLHILAGITLGPLAALYINYKSGQKAAENHCERFLAAPEFKALVTQLEQIDKSRFMSTAA